MLLRHSLGLDAEARRVETAVYRVLESGVRTRDLATPGTTAATTRQMGEAIRHQIAAAR
jgi:3-isopropylmalate dehydrogenase